MPLTVQRVKGIDQIAATRGKVALRFGPLMYSFENTDQKLGPENVLSPTAELQPQWKGDLLEGVMTIQGKWADGSPLLAIPNYARHNRGKTQSQVWVRDK